MLESPSVSQVGVFRAVVYARWLAIAMIPVQVALAQGRIELGYLVPATVLALAYNVLLTLNARRALDHLNASLWFVAVDMAFGLALYATGPHTNWLFFLFSITSIFMAGVRGRVSEGFGAGIVWNVIATACQYAWRLPVAQVLGVMALEDLFTLSMMGGMWAYAAGLVVRLRNAYATARSGAEQIAAANERLDEQHKVIVGLMDAGRAIASERDLVTIVGGVVSTLAGVGFGRCAVWILEEGVFRSVYPVGELTPDVAITAGSPLAEAVEQGRPVAIPPEAGSARGAEGSPLSIAVPILSDGEALGVLEIESVSGEAFDEADLALLHLFADQIALAIQHVRLYRQTQDLAVARERSRITREIQGAVVQEVYEADLIAESLRAAAVAPEVAATFRTLHDTIRSSLEDLRFAVLNWDSLEWQVDLADAVERYAAEMSALTGTAVSVVLRGEHGGCRPSRDHDVLRVLQAALSNVRRHAHARTVHVDLTCDGTALDLLVRDDGRGFDASEIESLPSGGIARMRELGRQGNGWVEVTSAPGDGTQVRLRLPC